MGQGGFSATEKGWGGGGCESVSGHALLQFPGYCNSQGIALLLRISAATKSTPQAAAHYPTFVCIAARTSLSPFPALRNKRIATIPPASLLLLYYGGFFLLFFFTMVTHSKLDPSTAAPWVPRDGPVPRDTVHVALCMLLQCISPIDWRWASSVTGHVWRACRVREF